MSTVINKGVNICCKAVMDNVLTVLVLLVVHSTSIAKPKDSLETYSYIR